MQLNFQTLSSVNPNRVQAIDGVRGLIMFFMALDHACWFLFPSDRLENMWGGELAHYSSPLFFLTSFIPHFAAPGFSFLMGVSMVYLAQNRRKLGWSEFKVLHFFIVRGLFFIGIQFLLENFLWSLRLRPESNQLVYFGVLFCLGSSMILAAFFLRVSKFSLLIISIAGLTVSWWAMPSYEQFSSSYSAWKRILFLPGDTQSISVYFSVSPWVFLTLGGIAFGKVLQEDTVKGFRLIRSLGIVALFIFLLVRYFTGLGNLRPLPVNATWMDYFVLTKYPPSFLFLCITLGTVGVLLGFWSKYNLGKFTFHFFEILGRAPFFFYLAHFLLFAFFGYWIGIEGASLIKIWGLWVVGVVLLMPLVFWFGAFKQRTHLNSLWRML